MEPSASPRASSCRRSGFTLLELLVVMAIIGTVLAIAVPAFQAASRNTRSLNGASQLVGDLRHARTEAIRRNSSVYVARTGPTTYHIEFVGHRTLPDGARFQSGPDTVRFSAFGPLQAGAGTYGVRVGTTTRTVQVNAAGEARLVQ